MIALRPATGDDAGGDRGDHARTSSPAPWSFEVEAPRSAHDARADGATPTGSIRGSSRPPARIRAACSLCLCHALSRNAMPIAGRSKRPIYVADVAQRQGVGRLLYQGLIHTLRAQGFTQAIARIALPNNASITLHEQVGFRRAGVFPRSGTSTASGSMSAIGNACSPSRLAPARTAPFHRHRRPPQLRYRAQARRCPAPG